MTIPIATVTQADGCIKCVTNITQQVLDQLNKNDCSIRVFCQQVYALLQ